METGSKYLPADERRAVTIEAVLALAAEENPSDITTAAIAKRMDLTQGAIFRHFPNKESILEAVLEWVSERLLARVDQAGRRKASPIEALEAVFTAHIAFIADHPGAPRMLLAELQRRGDAVPKRMVLMLIRNFRSRLMWLFERGIELGELDPALDTEAAALQYVGMIQSLVISSLFGGNAAQLLQDAPRVFALFRRGIVKNG